MSIKAYYGAGYRAGLAKPRIQYVRGNVDRSGIKNIIPPICPFTKPMQFLKRIIWDAGYYDGQMKNFSKPILKGN